MTAQALLTDLMSAFFVLLGILTLIDYIRHRDGIRRDTALTFGTITFSIVIALLRQVLPDMPDFWRTIASLTLMAQPYLFLRLVGYLQPVPSFLQRLAVGGMVTSWTCVLFLSALLPLPATLPIVGYFVVINAYVMVAFVQGARRTSGVVQRRLQLCASGAGLFVLTFIIAILATLIPPLQLPLAVLAQVAAMLSAIGFLIGIIPPRFLRRMWQFQELHDYLTRLSQQSDMPSVYAALAETAKRSVGGITAVVQDTDTAHTGTPLTVTIANLGTLVVYREHQSLFPDDDIELLTLLGQQTAVFSHNMLLVSQLQTANKELKAFSYSVSHDLRAPLRAIDGFSQALLEDHSHRLDDEGRELLGIIRTEAQRMGQLIDDLIGLAQISHTSITRQPVNLSAMAHEITRTLQERNPQRLVVFEIADNLNADGDSHLIRIVLDNLIGNAYKYSGKQDSPRVEFGYADGEYFVRDNGVGFDMAYADKLFGVFQRLHSMEEFEGTGIGLATVQRIISRHGGAIRADSAVNEGATFYFTLGGL